MFPSAKQYRKWSLPSQWSFWAAVTGIPIGVFSIYLWAIPHIHSGSSKAERARLLLSAAQELRYNNEWLASVALAHKRKSTIPTGLLKTNALLGLMEREYGWITRGAYGEEKNLYQLAFRLKDLSAALGSPTSSLQLARFNKRAEFTLNDIHVLNNFLLWYLRPSIAEGLDSTQLYSLGWRGFPGERFEVTGVEKLSLRHFTLEGKPILEFSEYLGLID